MRYGRLIFGNVLLLLLFAGGMLWLCPGCNDESVPREQKDQSTSRSEIKAENGERIGPPKGEIRRLPLSRPSPVKVVSIEDGLRKNMMTAGVYQAGDRKTAWIPFPKYLQGGAMRDENVEKIALELDCLPRASRPEVLIVDALHATQVGGVYYVGLYNAEGVSPEVAKVLSDLGLIRVERKDWDTMRSWVLELVGKSGTDRSSRLRTNGQKIVLISFYDGKKWHIKPWFEMGEVIAFRKPEKPDWAFYSLFDFMAHDLNPALTFPGNYHNELLGDKETREDARAFIEKGGDWRRWLLPDRRKSQPRSIRVKGQSGSIRVSP